MDDSERRARLKRHWDYAATDQDITHEIYHDDAVLEFPQSGERFEGVANFREWRREYPANLAFEMRHLRGSTARLRAPQPGHQCHLAHQRASPASRSNIALTPV